MGRLVAQLFLKSIKWKMHWAYGAQALLFGLALCLSLAGLRTVFLGDTAASRLATVYSLTQKGTWYIDSPAADIENPFEPLTIDKYELNGRLLSTKPPMLPLLMTGEYLVAHRLLGWELTQRDDLRALLRLMTFSFSICAYVVMLVFFAKILALFIDAPSRRIVPLAALAFGTQFLGFSPQLNNHVPGACMTVAMLYFALGLGSGKLDATWWRFFFFGLCGALVFTLDMPMTIYVVLAGMYLLWRFPRQAFLWGGLGMLGPLAVHFGCMLAVTGSPLPAQMNHDRYLFEGSYWRNPLGVDALHEPKALYFFHMTLGRYGVFLLFPILLLGFSGVVRAFFFPTTPFRGYYMAGLLGGVLLSLYYIQGTNNYGGAAYGFRWYMGSMPLWLLMATPVWKGMHKPWHWLIVLLLLAVSIFSGWEAYCTPWGVNQEWTCRYIFGPLC